MSVGKHHVISFDQKYTKISQLYIYIHPLYPIVFHHWYSHWDPQHFVPKRKGTPRATRCPTGTWRGRGGGWGGSTPDGVNGRGCKKWRRNNDQRNVQKLVLAVEMVNMAKFWESCCQIDVSPRFCLAMCWKIGCFRPNKMVGLGWMGQRRTET
jgi:hypothetical protein